MSFSACCRHHTLALAMKHKWLRTAHGCRHPIGFRYLFIKSFSLFAMLTSFLPSAVSFVDFLKDGLSKLTHQRVRNDLPIFIMVFIPPTICALVYPTIFLHALSFAGGFIDVLLFGVLPALVVLMGRRVKASGRSYEVMGGSVTPLLILGTSIALLVIKISQHL